MDGVVDRVFRERLKWKCRRGLLELDLVLEDFLRRRTPDLTDADWLNLEALLELPDNDLWDIVCARSDRYQPALEKVVVLLRSG